MFSSKEPCKLYKIPYDGSTWLQCNYKHPKLEIWQPSEKSVTYCLHKRDNGFNGITMCYKLYIMYAVEQ